MFEKWARVMPKQCLDSAGSNGELGKMNWHVQGWEVDFVFSVSKVVATKAVD